ncbi:MAG: hypothetical protein KDD50_16585, partial [Bdellovibrionales bacterium]|nr:hypothetical protein [Bdellovibrionales bacterium]
MKKYIWIAIILNTLTGCGGNTTKSIHPIDRSQFFLKEYSGTYTNGNNEDFVISPNGEFEQYLNVPALKNEAVFTNTEFICTYKLKGKIQNISFIPKKTKDVNYSYEVSSLFNTFGENLDYVLKLSYENSDIVGLTKLSNPSETTIKPEIIKQQAADCLNGLKSRKTYRIEFSNYYSSGLSLKDYSSIENNTWAINIDKNSMRRIPPDVNSYYYSENSFKIESRNLLQDNYVKALSPSSEGPSEKPHQNFSNYPQLFISDIKGLSFQSNSSFRYDLSFDSSGNKMVLQYKLYNCVFNYTWSIQSIEAYP